MFPDIVGLVAESQAAIKYLVGGGGLKGRGEGLFAPKANITREEVAILIYRTLNWPRLMADKLADATTHIMYFTTKNNVGTGSGWWRAPGVITTGKHVITERLDDGAQFCRMNGLVLRGMGGQIRSGLNEQTPYVVWETDVIDPLDLAYILVPPVMWEAYLQRRVEQGLSREPLYLVPSQGREAVKGEPCVAFGSPLMYEGTLSSGIVANVAIMRNEAIGIQSEWIMTTAGINPGNSGGPLVAFNGDLLGMNLLKPWYSAGSWGMTHGDDLGLSLTCKEILAWEQRRKAKFVAAGITL